MACGSDVCLVSWKLGLGWKVSFLRAGMFDYLVHGVSATPRKNSARHREETQKMYVEFVKELKFYYKICLPIRS